MTTKLLIATKNHGKLEELRRIFGDLGLELVSADELDLPDVDETGDTFEANAILKAKAQAEASGLMTIADDSGLEVDALDGAPGVISARYAGGGGSEANVRKLLAALADVPDERRTARFRCVLALADPRGALGERVELIEGRCEGRITREPRGTGGFGYDPVFLPEGEDGTMGEISAAAKDAISHRGRACAAMRERLAAYLGARR
ncbi:RdgB/HAM1 family non-canonical purine NTP pyrophosphatase [Sandaracinus amylolyticus]|uniref:RdgB/HAM1 family non-canonical purine NTP pyrophosphatase n=1 Tax=Sandaracinus amylolyticus TaxID=927083 RepID=UPI001F008B30|nr:RdgB/HAM1 family non-canonical purine NTP pyrophosphatase [Sandaracinus amylolyticus]UJR79611.1 XTP/dITP diphosphohydrolase [Sandaracinus amylolyticus]